MCVVHFICPCLLLQWHFLLVFLFCFLGSIHTSPSLVFQRMPLIPSMPLPPQCFRECPSFHPRLSLLSVSEMPLYRAPALWLFSFSLILSSWFILGDYMFTYVTVWLMCGSLSISSTRWRPYLLLLILFYLLLLILFCFTSSIYLVCWAVAAA